MKVPRNGACAQIAAFADAHFRVEKHTKDGRTITRVVRLGEEARVPLAAFSLEGSARKGLRSTVRRGRCRFRIVAAVCEVLIVSHPRA